MASAQPVRCLFCKKKAGARYGANIKRRQIARCDENAVYVCAQCKHELETPDEYRCLGKTKAGNRCKQWVLNFPTQYCWDHRGQ